MNQDEQAIRDVVATWMSATAAGDLPRVLELMADDVLFMVPGQKPMGKDAFAASFKGLAAFRMEGKSDIQEIQVLGDWAWLRNHITLTITPRSGGSPMRRSGYTLTIFRKHADGRWLLVRDANLMASEARN